MPELPDVELFRRRLRRHGLGRRVERVTVRDKRILQGLAALRFAKALEGKVLAEANRHGKHLLVHIKGGPWLTFHFGMTGALETARSGEDEPRFTRVGLDLDDGNRLFYTNRRMLGEVGLAEDAAVFVAARKLGPDALDPGLSPRALAEALRARRAAVKAVLMDQSLLAGLGNIYADEVLFQAQIHPAAVSSSLDANAGRALHRAIRHVLRTAIARGAGSEQGFDRLPRNFLLPRRRLGAPCPRCGTAIKALRVGGRQSFFCPACQPRPKRSRS